MEDEKRPKFGDRKLVNPSDVFQHNAWDNIDWTEEQEKKALAITESQLEKSASSDLKAELLVNPSNNWNKFYEIHDNKFFKDRHWLFTEFPELLHGVNTTSRNSKDTDYLGCDADERVLEIGCGAGNTIFPLIKLKDKSKFFMYGCDFSSSAIEVVKNSPEYDPEICHAFVHDITSEEAYPFPDCSLDIITVIFVLSALEFSKMKKAVERLAKLLKPGGLILFRDYGRFDLAQLRFKEGRCLDRNFYHRGDGTLVYFFTQDEIRDIFMSAGLIEEQNLVDRRLQVNRAKQLKMFRVWIQAKYRKPL